MVLPGLWCCSLLAAATFPVELGLLSSVAGLSHSTAPRPLLLQGRAQWVLVTSSGPGPSLLTPVPPPQLGGASLGAPLSCLLCGEALGRLCWTRTCAPRVSAPHSGSGLSPQLLFHGLSSFTQQQCLGWCIGCLTRISDPQPLVPAAHFQAVWTWGCGFLCWPLAPSLHISPGDQGGWRVGGCLRMCLLAGERGGDMKPTSHHRKKSQPHQVEAKETFAPRRRSRGCNQPARVSLPPDAAEEKLVETN